MTENAATPDPAAGTSLSDMLMQRPADADAVAGNRARMLADQEQQTPTQEPVEDIRARIEARFAQGWGAYLAVPDAWIPRLGELDRQLAALDPDYEIAQVKEKFWTLRYYLERPVRPACCIEWDAAHELPAEADADAEDQWEKAFNEHNASPEHLEAAAALSQRNDDMDALIHQAEVDIVELDKTSGAAAARRSRRVGARAQEPTEG